MKGKSKRLLSLMLCLLMLVGTMGNTVYAAKSTNKSKKINSAYAKVLKKIKTKYENDGLDEDAVIHYSFFDLTGDSTQELIVTHGISEQGMDHDVYTYRSGKAKKIGSFWAWHSSLGYKKNQQLLNYRWNYSGAKIYRVSIKSNKIKEKQVFSYSSDEDTNTTLEKKLKKKGYNKIKWLKTCDADSRSLLNKTFPK